MSTEIQKQWVDQFNALLDIQPQQMVSKLLTTVSAEFGVEAETAWYNRVGIATGQQRTDRYADAPNNPKTRQRRGVTPTTYDVGEIYDKIDSLRMLSDPGSEDMEAMRAYCARQIDATIAAAAVGTALTRNADNTSSNDAFDTSTKRVAVNVVNKGDTPANSGMNIGKLRKGLEILAAAEIDPDTDEIYCVLGQQQVGDLLEETKVGSADYNGLMPLMTGQVGRFMGVNFVRYTGLAVPVSNQRQCLLYTKKAIKAVFTTPQPIIGDMWERPDKAGKPWYGYAKTDVGAVRRHDEGVVDILCLES
jgi:hypothetical protein